MQRTGLFVAGSYFMDLTSQVTQGKFGILCGSPATFIPHAKPSSAATYYARRAT